jgi:hypothetical protein
MNTGWSGRLALALGVLVAGCGSGSSGAGDARKQCAQLEERLVDIQMQNVTADREQHRAAYRAALDDRFAAHCLDEMSADERDCVLAANDAAALVACHTD